MPVIRSFVLLFTLLSLVACEQSANPPTPPKAPVDQAQSVTSPAERTSSAVIRHAAKPASSPEVNSREQPRSKPAEPVVEHIKPQAAVKVRPPEVFEPKAPIDLSLRLEVFDPLQPLQPLNDLSTPLLPPLFAEKVDEQDGFQLNGKLITNDNGDDYWQSVEGAQLQFEFKQ
ncbi:hypothetical protein [Pseudomonas sp. TMP25]|uniref:hypothetical protein n=1 Tax=Pseudomonas sp. TMP25 TaxID=3136561 RepID=UPI003100CB53